VDLPIPFSYFGTPEAGLFGKYIFASRQTPIHSVLHEAAHVICMSPQRRRALRSDAGGEYSEENCVLYLQVTMAPAIGVAHSEMCSDMDAWGYTFRLGSALAWYQSDASECRQQLMRWGVLDATHELTFHMRMGDGD